MKKIFTLFCLFLSTNSFGQDTVRKPLQIHPIVQTKDTSKYEFTVDYKVGIATRNVWRGLDYGSAASISADLFLGSKYWDIGVMGTSTMNGNRSGYGIWMELYTTFKLGSFYLTFDDYYFFNADTTNNNYDGYFNWTPRNTNHILETRLGYTYKEYLDVFVGFPIYKNAADKTNGLYIEVIGRPWKFMSFTLAGLTGPSGLNFYNAGGITTIAINGHKDIRLSEKIIIPIKASFIVNPNYKNAWNTYDNGTPTGVTGSPVYFTLSMKI